MINLAMKKFAPSAFVTASGGVRRWARRIGAVTRSVATDARQ